MQSPFPQSTYERNARIYKILANPKRLEILNLLKRQGELSCEDIMHVVRVPKANLSQHLAIMRHVELVKARRDGLNVRYRIVDPRIVEPCSILHDFWRNRAVKPAI